MSIRAIPLLVFAFVLYNAVVLLVGPDTGLQCAKEACSVADQVLAREIFSVKMLSTGVWRFTWGDFILVVTFILLFAEIVKSTFSTTSTLIDHGLSMLVFIAVGVEFLMVAQAATSVFFLILVATLIDVIGGYTIGIRVARHDLNIGADQ